MAKIKKKPTNPPTKTQPTEENQPTTKSPDGAHIQSQFANPLLHIFCIYVSFSKRNSIKDFDLSKLQMPEKACENLLSQFLLKTKIDTDINWKGCIMLGPINLIT